jgi:hypothetical protein
MIMPTAADWYTRAPDWKHVGRGLVPADERPAGERDPGLMRRAAEGHVSASRGDGDPVRQDAVAVVGLLHGDGAVAVEEVGGGAGEVGRHVPDDPDREGRVLDPAGGARVLPRHAGRRGPPREEPGPVGDQDAPRVGQVAAGVGDQVVADAVGHPRSARPSTGVGPVEVEQPRVRDRRPADQRESFSSAILPPYLRKTKSLEDLVPWLHLKGVSTGDFTDTLEALLGPDAPGLSAPTVTRLKAAWSRTASASRS